MRIGRRAFLWGAAAAALGLSGYGALRFGRRRKLIPVIESTPAADGFRMPGEFERQEAVWLVWPEAPDWRLEGEPARKVVAELAAAIAGDIPVRLAVTSGQAARARSMLTGSVEVVEITAGSGWIRDDGPTFLIDDGGARRGVDWDFNNWGYAGPVQAGHMEQRNGQQNSDLVLGLLLCRSLEHIDCADQNHPRTDG